MLEMPESRHEGFSRQMIRFLTWGTLSGQEDGQILERFAIHGDEAAFEALVSRHGPTVLGVCRRFLRDPNDVDDAFQATFVILARKASGLRDRNALGPWLHGVAFKVASRARVEAERRRRREAADHRDIAMIQAPETGAPDLRWLLDEEILRLPDKLRLPVVLCLIEGRTYDEAAEQLRWSAAMVRGRLAEARGKLRARLTRRGAAPSVLLATCKIETPVVPRALIDSASRITLGVLTGQAGAAPALKLANRTMRNWLMTRIAKAGLIMIAAGVALGIGSNGLKLWAVQEDEGKPGLVQAKALAEEKAVAEKAQAAPRKRRRGSVESDVHPITIVGRAVDHQGKPVAGASIFVTNANRSRSSGDDALLGREVSGPDGRFILRALDLPVLQPNPGPIPRGAEGKFEVAGTAPGLAFTWHAVQTYRPIPKPAESKAPVDDLVFFSGQPIVADLVFGPPALVRGRIIDDQGRPVAGAKIQFGYTDDPRKPNGHGIRRCSVINPAGGDELSFNGVESLPEEARTARTDAEGRYSIKSLPREVKLLTLIDQEPTVEPRQLTIATSAVIFPGVQSLGYEGVLNHTFILPRTIPIQVTFADSNQPAPNVTVTAQGERPQRVGAIGTTDPEGRTTLAIPPGAYTLRAEPSIDQEYLVSEIPLSVGSKPPEAQVALSIPPGSPMSLKAVDADTGRGIPGVGFVVADDTSADRHEVHSGPTYVDHPVTGDSGDLRVVTSPGRRQFFPGRIPRNYESVTKGSPMLTLKPGEQSTARFEFRKKVDPEAEAFRPEEDDAGRQLRLLWENQAGLIRRGRLRGIRTYQSGDSIPPERLRQLLASLDGDKIPTLANLIQSTFPEAQEPSSVVLDITVDDPLRRQRMEFTQGAKKRRADVTVYNGRESVHYDPGNAQVDIGDDDSKSGVRFGVAGIADFCHWPQWGGKVVRRDDGRVTVTVNINSGKYVSRIVADESTGFVYSDLRSWADGSSGHDYWQFAPRVTAEGAIVPGLSVEHRYQKDKTNVIWIKVVESVDLKTAIPPEAFLVSVPTGTMILDYREGRDDTYRGVATRPVTDIVALADANPRRYKPFMPPIKPGQPAPLLSPQVWIGGAKEMPAPNLSGKVVLIDFWGMDCGPCIAQLPEVREAAEHFTSKGLVLIGLHDSSGTPEAVADFATKRGLTWPLAIDRDGEGFGATFKAYGVRSIPRAAVIDRQGKLAFLGQFREALAQAANLLDQK